MVKYNGWKNYETWKLAVEIQNTEHLYNQVKKIVEETDSHKDARKRIKALFPNAKKGVSFAEITKDFFVSMAGGEL